MKLQLILLALLLIGATGLFADHLVHVTVTSTLPGFDTCNIRASIDGCASDGVDNVAVNQTYSFYIPEGGTGSTVTATVFIGNFSYSNTVDKDTPSTAVPVYCGWLQDPGNDDEHETP